MIINLKNITPETLAEMLLNECDTILDSGAFPYQLNLFGRKITVNTYSTGKNVINEFDLLAFIEDKYSVSIMLKSGYYMIFLLDCLTFDTLPAINLEIMVRTLSHELGHIFYEHSEQNSILGLSPDPETQDKQEQQAKAFEECYLRLYQRRVNNNIKPPSERDKIDSTVNQGQEPEAPCSQNDIKPNPHNSRRFLLPLISISLILCFSIFIHYTNSNTTDKDKHTEYIAAEQISEQIKESDLSDTISINKDLAETPLELQPTPTPFEPIADALEPTGPALVEPSKIDTTTASEDISEMGTAPETESSELKIIYVTAYGNKFHRESCRYLNQNNETNMPQREGVISMTIEEALSLGYGACLNCRPMA